MVSDSVDRHREAIWAKNFVGKSTYAPPWVKTNPTRFPRMMLRTARGQLQVADVLSILHPEVVRADARAFETLMQHLREIDKDYSTVIMVQVENEVGLLGDSRDASPEASARFHAPVPDQLVKMLDETWHLLHPSLKSNLEVFRRRRSKMQAVPSSWPEMFGDSSVTDELFMAYHYALYVEQVARSGKAMYPLPLFTNVWQNYADKDADRSQPVIVGGGGQPGDYPSGGGVINVLDIWQHFAPSLSFIAPDVYLNDYEAVCNKYRHRGQPLFIPEQRRDEYGARRIWSAYGTYHALGASPFAIDTLEPVDSPWGKHFGLLDQVSESILAAQETAGSSFGFFFDELDFSESSSRPLLVRMGDWNLSVERSFVFGKPGPGFGMIIRLSEARFLLVGEGFQVRFSSAKEGSLFTGILSFVEKVSDPRTKKLKTGRILNGDETRSGELAIMPSESPDLGEFPICITIPARTKIAECEVYSF